MSTRSRDWDLGTECTMPSRAVSLVCNKELMEAEGEKDMAWGLTAWAGGWATCAREGWHTRVSRKHNREVEVAGPQEGQSELYKKGTSRDI